MRLMALFCNCGEDRVLRHSIGEGGFGQELEPLPSQSFSSRPCSRIPAYSRGPSARFRIHPSLGMTNHSNRFAILAGHFGDVLTFARTHFARAERVVA